MTSTRKGIQKKREKYRKAENVDWDKYLMCQNDHYLENKDSSLMKQQKEKYE